MDIRFIASEPDPRLSPLEPWIVRKIGVDALTKDVLQSWQLARVNDTLQYIGRNSRRYKKKLAGYPEKLESLAQLGDLPFTTGAEIAEDPNGFVCVPQDEIQRIVTMQTSGTTGAPKRVFFTAADQELTIDFFGVGMNTLTDSGANVLILLPGSTPNSVGDLLANGLLQQGRVPIKYGPFDDPSEVVNLMESQSIQSMVGSPVQVLELARRWKKGVRGPKSVLLSTDYVPHSIVRVLESTWGCKVFNHYGTTEMGLGGGVECEAHAGYHLREADLLFEIVDPQSGQPMTEGEYGEVVFTTLTRAGMPLLRYRTGDKSCFLPGNCPCGSIIPRMECISGRFDNVLKIGGRNIPLSEFDERLFAIDGVLDFSVDRHGCNEEKMTINLRVLEGFDPSNEVRKQVATIHGLACFSIDVRLTDATGLPRTLRKRIFR